MDARMLPGTKQWSALVLALLLLTAIGDQASGQGLFDRFKAGRHKDLKENFHTKEVHHGPPYDLLEIAHMVDIVEEGVLDDGTIVIKQPDIWGQARMTKFRRQFEAEMQSDVGRFAAVLSARVARSDQASFENATLVSSALAGSVRPAQTSAGPLPTLPDNATADALTAQQDLIETQRGLLQDQNAAISQQNQDTLALLKERISERESLMNQTLGLLATPEDTTITRTAPFGLFPEGKPLNAVADRLGGGKLGLEPTIYLDEKKRYLDHLSQIRRVNLGDDNASTAGYALYLIRMPISIEPGQKTRKGHGATFSATVRPEYGPHFLPQTYRNLVITDLVDQLTPFVFKILEQNLDKDSLPILEKIALIREEIAKKNRQPGLIENKTSFNPKYIPRLADSELSPMNTTQLGQVLDYRSINLLNLFQGKLRNPLFLSNRIGERPYPIPPTAIKDVFLVENLLWLSAATRSALATTLPRATDVRSFLAQELGAAYDLIPQVGQYPVLVEQIADAVEKRQFGLLGGLYDQVVGNLPGDLVDQRNVTTSILFYSIAVDAGLLNRRLHEEMKSLIGQRNFVPPCEVEGLAFYLPDPMPEAHQVFQQYVNARWPIITFALDPVTDQQNIADATSIRRDLQIAIAFALSTGRVNLNQFNRFRRRIEIDSETIALNRTVTSFAHGNDTFGWKFFPRYQNPPIGASNISVLGGLLARGGPGPDARLRTSQLESGQRELTAVVIMPSFLQRVKFEVAGNWFPLANPDDPVVPTARMIWQGQRIMEVRDAVTRYCDPKLYRAGEVERVLAKIDRVERSLPLQTEFVNVPYENAEGGFDLFTPGLSSLAPRLVGHEGISHFEENRPASLLLYAKDLDLEETIVVAGGIALDPDDCELLSREIIRVSIPAGVMTTLYHAKPDAKGVEIQVATPNGISNRLLIPFQAKATAAAPATTATMKTTFSLVDPPRPVAYLEFNQNGGLGAEANDLPGHSRVAFESKPALVIAFAPTTPNLKIPSKVTKMAFLLQLKDAFGHVGQIETDDFEVNAEFAKGRTEIPFQGVGDTIITALADPKTGLKKSQFSGKIEVKVETAIQIDSVTLPIELDNEWTITLDPQPAPAAGEPDGAMDNLPPPLPDPPLPTPRTPPRRVIREEADTVRRTSTKTSTTRPTPPAPRRPATTVKH